MDSDYRWPEPPHVADLRQKLDALTTGLAACIAYAAARDGRCPIGQLRALLKETP